MHVGMAHASRTSAAADVATEEHKQALAVVESHRHWLLQLQDIKDREASARRASAEELAERRSDLSVLHARLAAASQQQHSQLSTGASQAAARVAEVKQVQPTLVIHVCSEPLVLPLCHCVTALPRAHGKPLSRPLLATFSAVWMSIISANSAHHQACQRALYSVYYCIILRIRQLHVRMHVVQGLVHKTQINVCAMQAEQAVHADLMEAARKEREARALQLDLQTQADGLLDQYIVLCASRSPGGSRGIQPETPEGAAIKKQLQFHREKSDEAARLVQDLCNLRTSLQVRASVATQHDNGLLWLHQVHASEIWCLCMRCHMP